MRGVPQAVLVALALAASGAGASVSGLNTIPTTDIVPFRNWLGVLQNGNAGFGTPRFYLAPNALLQSEFAVTPRIEAGADWIQPPDLAHRTFVFNVKGALLAEDDRTPGVAGGIWNIAVGQTAGYFVTVSKTLNYGQQQEERFRAHNRRSRKLLGRRVHAGLAYDGRGGFEPFLGTDLQLNESAVFQADWIAGQGNALTFGVANVLPDQRTVITPVLLFSNDRKRVDGFFLNLSHQLNL